jgi:hypothetical protein
VRYRRQSLHETVPAELLDGLTIEPADILRTGSVGFTAMLSDAQRLAVQSHPVVAGVEDNPDCLAPLHRADRKPDVPNRYVVKILWGLAPATVIANVDLRAADVEIMGARVIATLTTDQFDALRRTPGVDFIAPAKMVYPA